ncbi:hypothetical protein JA1_002766 [Spathaspora sp. JA1]|nr:hypothetical protein JA1_002766 [Spathaspora sp. JA1]
MRFAIINALFLTGTIAVTITTTTTLTTITPNDSINVQPGGIVTFLNVIQFIVSSISIQALGQFVFRTSVGGGADISGFTNRGYALFDLSQRTSVFLPFENLNLNTGEFIVYGNAILVDMYRMTNAGSMTLWGTSGTASFNQLENSGKICLRSVIGRLQSPGGSGCFALSQTSVYVIGTRLGFEPTVTFIGNNNGFEVQTSSALPPNFILNNFGIGDYVAVPPAGFDGQWNYDSTSGVVTVYFQGSPVTFNVGKGYTEERFSLVVDGLFYLRYLDPVPVGANQGGCGCVLNINTASSTVSTEVETSSTDIVETPPEETTTIETSTSVEETTEEVTTGEEETTPEETTSEQTTSDQTTDIEDESTTFGTTSEDTNEVETTTEEDSSSSSIIPEPTDCKHGRRNRNHDCPGYGHGPGHGHGNNNGHGNGHNDNHDNNNGHNSGHGGNGKDHGSPPKGNQGHGNDNNHGNGNNHGNDDNHGNGKSNRKGNDHDNGRNNGSNGKGNDRGNSKENSHGEDNGNKGKGHKRQEILENSGYSNHVVNSMLAAIFLVWLLIV